MQNEGIPDPIPPQYSKNKELYLKTALVAGGTAQAAIIAPGVYQEESLAIQSAIKKLTGVVVPIIADGNSEGFIPLTRNVVLLGNRSDNGVLCRLYDLFYSLTDLKYPGAGGFEVRSVHNPFGNGCNAIILGGSDGDGVRQAVGCFIENIALQKIEHGELSVGWLLSVKLGSGSQLPEMGCLAPTWQDFQGFNDERNFGWNSISQNMALYYMTGQEAYAREVVRLAFPDEEAEEYIGRVDGERIENKSDPLAGPYHYNATRMILFWDLIEESPVFSDAEKLRVTNAFSRQLRHRIGEGVYSIAEPVPVIGGRHDVYSALSLYVLARYFARDYKDEVWIHALKASGEYYFAPLRDPGAWVNGNNDNLFWYGTVVAPFLDYCLLSGDWTPVNGGALKRLLKTQELLWNGSKEDPNLVCVALDFLNKAAYLTGDKRWIYYRERLSLDVLKFRLDQSFWPPALWEAEPPDDLVDRWTIDHLPPAQHLARGTGFSRSESFSNMSYRNAIDDDGDYMLLDGMNGEARNPYHTFALIYLRINGDTLLSGYLNQVRTSSRGVVKPKVPLDAALQNYVCLGGSVAMDAAVPEMPYCRWERNWYLRRGKYAVAVDSFLQSEKSNDFEIEFWWQNYGSAWRKGSESSVSDSTQIVNIDRLYTQAEGDGVKFIANISAERGDRNTFFFLVAANGTKESIRGKRLAPNAALFSAPDEILISKGNYADVTADLAVRGPGYFFASGLLNAPDMRLSSAVDMDWDWDEGIIHLNAPAAAIVAIKLRARDGVLLNGNPLHPQSDEVTVELTGENVLTGAYPTDAFKASYMRGNAQDPTGHSTCAPRFEEIPRALSRLKSGFHVQITGQIEHVLEVQADSESYVFASSGNDLIGYDRRGSEFLRISTDSEVSALHWSADAGLLLVGTKGQKVGAYALDGELKWTFQSEMAAEVHQSGKTYWYNTAPGHEGVHGIDSGCFIGEGTQFFVGSACTLEILDCRGNLVKRLPQFWGTPAMFRLIDGPRGGVKLAVIRSITERAQAHLLDSRSLDPHPVAFYAVPKDCSYIGGWIDQRHLHLFYLDVDGDGEKKVIGDIAGAWNRISIWNSDGEALWTINIGPGPSPYLSVDGITPAYGFSRSLIRDTDASDIDSDGSMEVVTALSSGRIIALDSRCNIKWSRRFLHTPTCVKIVNKTIFVGDEGGGILALNGAGDPVAHERMDSPISSLLKTSQETLMAVSGNQIRELSLE